MKKIQLAFLLIVLGWSAYAQFDGTKFVIGGAVDYNTDASTNVSSLGLSPSFAKVINASSLIGVTGGYSTSVTKNDGSNAKNTSSQFRAGIYYQKFYGMAERIFFNWRALAGMRLTDQQDNSSSYSTNGFEATLVPGFSWKANDKLLLTATLGGFSFVHDNFSNHSDSFSQEYNSNQLGVRFNNPQFGFIFLLK